MISGMLEFAEQAGLSVMMTETAHKDLVLECRFGAVGRGNPRTWSGFSG